jgi:type I restriction enzyme S subunit
VTLDLEERHREHIRTILGQHLGGRRGVRVYAYGSRVRGNAHRFSDVDLAIESAQPIGVELLFALRNAFDDSNLPYSVDVTDLAHATPGFRASVDRDRELIFET